GLGKVEQKILAERIRKVRNDEPVFQPIHAVMERYGKRKLDGRSVRQLKKTYSKDSYRRAVKRGLERAERHGVKIQHWTPYQLRHSAATELSIQLGREAAGVMLGHASANVTAGYDHSDREKVRKLVAERDVTAGTGLVKWEG
ncbi:MAG: tyrosine-type recombinase/integrase, partial [Thermoguttaceae bacterium]|nr:tyrosine-type recombinase/integrase [Thermoguttaceae bacterium]